MANETPRIASVCSDMISPRSKLQIETDYHHSSGGPAWYRTEAFGLRSLHKSFER